MANAKGGKRGFMYAAYKERTLKEKHEDYGLGKRVSC